MRLVYYYALRLLFRAVVMLAFFGFSHSIVHEIFIGPEWVKHWTITHVIGGKAMITRAEVC